MRHAAQSAQMEKRMRARYLASCDRYQADKHKPATRDQINTWLAPIRQCLAQMAHTGEIETLRGYAVTQLGRGDDWARIDHAINGFSALIKRLLPDTDLSALERVSRRLGNGAMLERGDLDACLATVKVIENDLRQFTRAQLVDAANTEMINIEFERMGVKS